MPYLLPVFISELLLLYFFSLYLQRLLSLLLHNLTHNKKLTVYLIALLFLPGTVIHEVSHFVMAKLLFVRAGKISITPVLDGQTVKLGTVEIGKTDPVRRILIGLAPMLLGTILILCTIYLSLSYFKINNIWLNLLIIYLIFEIANTMFSSKKDLEGSMLFFIIIVLSVITAYLTGIRLHETISAYEFTLIIQKAIYYLLIPLVLDCIIVLALGLLKKVLNY